MRTPSSVVLIDKVICAIPTRRSLSNGVKHRYSRVRFNGANTDPAVVDEAWTEWREEVAHAEGCVESFAGLGQTAPNPQGR